MAKEDNPFMNECEILDGGGLYLHVSYCRKKCLYCDFFSAGERIADWPRYVDALCSELNHRKKEMAWPLRTVYIGGGTPSLMPEGEFLRLCSFLRPYLDSVEEFTIEVNPDDVDEHMLEVWKKAGVNRLSFGIQTFDDSTLAAIGRRHDGKTAISSYDKARKVFDNISIDLMFGLPGQSLDVWKRDLQTVLSLRPEHISAYSLMFEEGTALTALRDAGRISEVPEEMSENMFSMLIDQISKAGYEHYEISNFALPGFRSRHNSSYWLQKPYIGLGPSAHSYDGKAQRKGNRADLRGYLDHWAPVDGSRHKGEGCIVEEENLSDIELMEEYILTRMRTKEGIPLSDFFSRFGLLPYEKLKKKCFKLEKEGLIEWSCSNVRLSERAIMVSDYVIIQLSSLC